MAIIWLNQQFGFRVSATSLGMDELSPGWQLCTSTLYKGALNNARMQAPTTERFPLLCHSLQCTVFETNLHKCKWDPIFELDVHLSQPFISGGRNHPIIGDNFQDCFDPFTKQIIYPISLALPIIIHPIRPSCNAPWGWFLKWLKLLIKKSSVPWVLYQLK